MPNESQQDHLLKESDDRSFRSVCESIEGQIGPLLESMPDGVIVSDSSGRIVLVNSQAEKMFGFGRDDLVSHEVEELVPNRFRPHHLELRDAYIAGPEKRQMGQDVLLCLRNDGSEFNAEISLSPMYVDEGMFVLACVRDVTRRTQVETALREHEEQVRAEVLEERYHDLYLNSPDMCASIEAATGRIVDCNNTLIAAIGYTRDELLAMPHISHLYHPDFEDARKEVFRAFTESGTVRDEELQLLCKDRSVMDVSLSLTAVRDKEGKIVRSRSVWRDITRRKQAERALEQSNLELEQRVDDRTAKLAETNIRLEEEITARKKSEEWLLAAQSAAKVGVWELDLLTQRWTCSDEFFHIHGRQPDGSAPTLEQQIEWIHPEDRERVSGELRSALADHSPLETEFRVVGPQGAIHRLICKGTVSRDDAGVPVCIAGATFDVTDQMEVESALRTSEERVRLLLDSTVESIYGLDMKGNCTFCNRACVESLGYQSTEELLGQNMHDLIHHTRSDGSPYPMQESKIYEAFRRGKGTHVDDEVLWKADGSSFAAEYRSFPLSRDGQLIGSVVTFLDVTEKRRVAEALRTQQSELTHAARLSTLGEMAAGLAHELNQPLTAMSAFAEGALVRHERGTLLETETISLFSRIAEDAQRAGDIIRRLRDFVQKREAQRHALDVNILVRDVHKFVKSDAKHESIDIQFDLGDGLPAVEADPIELQQVLLNLIRNAFDALARNDADDRTVVISTREREFDRVEVVVKDSGPGISRDMAEQVFEPFYTSKANGLGIGLGICQNIIESHGGTIWLGEPSTEGASIHFDLPSHQMEQESDES